MVSKNLSISELTDVIGPSSKLVGPVRDGGTITARTAPGCWGPMLTPEIRAGHEVTVPIAVEGASRGDAVALSIEKIEILSEASSSGIHKLVEGRYVHDPMIDAKCPTCGVVNPPTFVDGCGNTAIRCKGCGEPVAPFKAVFGFTMVFEKARRLGVTVPSQVSIEIAHNPAAFASLPKDSKQHPSCVLGLADIEPTLVRVRQFIGNIGTLPGIDMPCNRNAGDSILNLVGAEHEYGITIEKVVETTDGHMDNNKVSEGSILIAPVKVEGGGIYVGDVHAMQGEGEVAGHTTDVSAKVVLRVHVMKGLNLAGPILLPNRKDLPPLIKPYLPAEISEGRELAQEYGFEIEPEAAPVYFIGSGENINAAVDCAMERMATATGMDINEVRTRVTISGSVEICRLPGVAQVSALLPLGTLKKIGFDAIVRSHYGLRGS